MNYSELIEKALGGKSVNARAKELGLPQKSLDQYAKAARLPDCDVAIILAKAANVSIEEAVIAIASKKAELRPERVHSFLRPAVASVLMAVSFVLVAATGLLPAGNANAASIDVGSKTTASANSLFHFRSAHLSCRTKTKTAVLIR